jgi:hypothetical protein
MATAKIKTYGVGIEDSALAFSTPGVTPSAWLQNAASQVWGAIKNGVKAVTDFAGRIFEGGKELLSAIGRGDWKLFLDFGRDQPGAALAGVGAIGITGWFIGSVTGIGAAVSSGIGSIAAFASGGISSLWATLSSIRFGGVAVGAMLPSIQQVLVSGGNTIINTDWAQSDKSILSELESTYLTFLSNVGESTGRLLAGLLIGKKSNPKLRLNITATAALVITARQQGSEIEEEMVEELSQLANVFIRYATNLAGKLGLLKVREWARTGFRTGIKAIDSKIENLGLQEGQSWSIAQKIEEKVEKLKETDEVAGTLAESLLGGFGDGLQDYLLMT